MTNFKAMLEAEEGMSDSLRKETLAMIKKIIDVESKLKSEALKLDKRYQKEMRKSFFFNYIYNDTPITKDDIKFIEDKK